MRWNADLVNAKQSDIDGRRLVLLKPLKEDIVDIPTPLVGESTDYKVDIPWQLSLHPTQCFDELLWQELMWQGNLHRNGPHWTLLALG